MRAEKTTTKIRFAAGLWRRSKDLVEAEYRVTFAASNAPFAMLESFCDNPECDCYEARLEFIELPTTALVLKRPLSFFLRLDLAAGRAFPTQEDDGHIRALAEEFTRDLQPEMLAKFRADYDFEKAHCRKAADFSMPAKEVEEGKLISYAQVFGKDGSIMHGGRGYACRLEAEESTYIVEDLYCPNPACHCHEAWLIFLRQARGTNAIVDGFDVRVSLKGKVKEIGAYSCSREEAEQLFVRWRSENPDGFQQLACRYEEIKSVGARILAEASDVPNPKAIIEPMQPPRASDGRSPTSKTSFKEIPSRKTGRNDPCPCGSGRKFKKCCGR